MSNLKDRFLRYVTFDTKSDAASDTCPSTPGQRVFAEALVEEMKAIGIADAFVDGHGYVYGTIPANLEGDVPVVGFIAHMDVASEVPSTGIRARVVEKYDGGDILLNAEKGLSLSPAEFESLKKVVGHALIVTDGTTLLGGDDKAGIAIILTMADRLIRDPSIKHGTIKLGFTPDEEIGRGADLFDVKGFGADFAYTVDGGAFGGMEYETFNAASAVVTFTGRSIHPGGAKGKLLNASLLAMEFHGLLPAAERPEHTEGREGFYHLISIKGETERAELRYILRDHDRGILEGRKARMQAGADFLTGKYGEGCVSVELRDTYANMYEMILPHWHIVETAYEAIRELGGQPVSMPVRGGTDGCRLSFMGLPCPNLPTGGRGAHGRFEYVSVDEMALSVELLIRIAQKYGQKTREELGG
ncbi:MAG: peptidase T [Clostridiales bacterium]|nr:peptidase T [Clostridiales bacterium]